jgi:gentisate 1,2-dioxygenase
MFYLKIANIFKRDPITKQTTNEFSEEIFEYLYTQKWYALEKIDGTNLCVNWDGHKVSYTGRTEKSQFSAEQKSILDGWFLTTAFEELCESVFGEKTATIFGEFAGAGIQKGGYYNENKFFIAFDVVVGDVWCKL